MADIQKYTTALANEEARYYSIINKLYALNVKKKEMISKHNEELTRLNTEIELLKNSSESAARFIEDTKKIIDKIQAELDILD